MCSHIETSYIEVYIVLICTYMVSASCIHFGNQYRWLPVSSNLGYPKTKMVSKSSRLWQMSEGLNNLVGG